MEFSFAGLAPCLGSVGAFGGAGLRGQPPSAMTNLMERCCEDNFHQKCFEERRLKTLASMTP